MTLKDYLNTESVQLTLNNSLDLMISTYGWTSLTDLQDFYNKYVDLVSSGQLPEILMNQTSSYYTDLETKFGQISGMPYSYNFISNFIDLAINKYDVPANIYSPVSNFNKNVQPNLDTTNNLSVALSTTGSQITGVVKDTFTGIGNVLTSALSGLFSSPIIIIIVVGIIVFILFKDKIMGLIK
jgi:hypothetical protein